jgi:hypothetical protein
MAVENYLFYGGLLTGSSIIPVPFHGFNMFGPLTPGPLLWVGLALMCLTSATRRARLEYASLQIALWFISASIWSPILWLTRSTQYGSGGELIPFFLATLVLSVLLFLLYKPVVAGLRQLSFS